MADVKMVTMSRIKYFRMTTGRNPSALEILQNAGFVTIPKKELEDMQTHKWDSIKNYTVENG